MAGTGRFQARLGGRGQLARLDGQDTSETPVEEEVQAEAAQLLSLLEGGDCKDHPRETGQGFFCRLIDVIDVVVVVVVVDDDDVVVVV